MQCGAMRAIFWPARSAHGAPVEADRSHRCCTSASECRKRRHSLASTQGRKLCSRATQRLCCAARRDLCVPGDLITYFDTHRVERLKSRRSRQEGRATCTMILPHTCSSRAAEMLGSVPVASGFAHVSGSHAARRPAHMLFGPLFGHEAADVPAASVDKQGTVALHAFGSFPNGKRPW